MLTFIIAVTSIFLWTGCQSCQFSDTFDPCSGGNHILFPLMSDRCPDCEYLSDDRNDLYDLNHDIWYISEFNMTTRYVSPYGCGTRLPIWMNGTIPMLGEGVVSRTACVGTFEKLCASSYSIKVKRCDPYNTVYCLENLPNIQQRYCFDVDPRIFTTTTSTRTSAKLQSILTTDTHGIDRRHKPDHRETRVESWVIAVIAVLSLTIVGLITIIVVVMRQFRQNHKRHENLYFKNIPPTYVQAIDVPIEKKVWAAFENVKPKY